MIRHSSDVTSIPHVELVDVGLSLLSTLDGLDGVVLWSLPDSKQHRVSVG
jgi:hypothetical protein